MHSSVRAHLSTEFAVLSALYKRSRAQHRSQIFLTRLEGVLRLTRLVLRRLGEKLDERQLGSRDGSKPTTPVTGPASRTSKPATPVTGRASPATEDEGSGDDRLKELVRRLVAAVISAFTASSRVLALAQFVPLHTLLVASYGRLFAVSVHLAQTLGMSLDDLLVTSGSKDIMDAGAVLASVAEIGDTPVGERVVSQVGGEGPDFGEKLDRAAVRRLEVGAPDFGEKLDRAAVRLDVGGPDFGEKLDRAALRASTTESKMGSREADAASDITPAETPESEPGPRRKSEVKPKKRKEEGIIVNDPPPKKRKDAAIDSDPQPKKKAKAAGIDDIFSAKPKKKAKTDGIHDIVADKPMKKKDKMDIFGEKPKKNEKKPKDKAKLKSKKKDAMDDIFGF